MTSPMTRDTYLCLFVCIVHLRATPVRESHVCKEPWRSSRFYTWGLVRRLVFAYSTEHAFCLVWLIFWLTAHMKVTLVHLQGSKLKLQHDTYLRSELVQCWKCHTDWPYCLTYKGELRIKPRIQKLGIREWNNLSKKEALLLCDVLRGWIRCSE